MSQTNEAPDVETSSDAYAKRFSGKAGAFFLERQERVVLDLLADKRGVTVLDVGGGHGQLTGPLTAAGNQVTVIGSTPGCEARVHLDPRARDVRFVTGDLLALPFADRSFDTAVSIRLMAHISDWQLLVTELCRVANRTILIDYPDLASLNLLSTLTFGVKKRIEGDTRQFRNFWTSQIAAELAKHGFRIAGRSGQFLLPMGLHRAAKGALPIQLAERAADRLGLTGRFGNPAVLRADRG